ncbi:hypothetical protein MKK65_11815 [Methylobacterium sp. J-001]|uniref:hypothetical protein n=1 Tax=Methylobacterium sp. J-001 TaxID=2836609 RepID=UPI001FB976AC|nr:hypothetical protein [Methylobacterium sp. J-001]MCJ2117237.1 hypothetical protein [Methylobacterium sp. J-001]
MVTDPTADLATFLLTEAAKRTPSIFAFLVAEGRHLPEDPNKARQEIRYRWPELTDQDRETAFRSASLVLRRIERDCAENIARLDALTTAVGRG